MTATAIQEDVGAEEATETEEVQVDDQTEEVVEDAEEPSPPKSPRELIMEQAVKNRQKVVAEEIAEDPEREEPESDEPKEKTVKIKIDGEEREVTEEEIRQYQKGQAADKRLREANERLKRAQEIENSMARRMEALEAQAKQRVQEGYDQATTKQEVAEVDALAQKLTASIYDDDVDGVKEVMRQLASNSKPAPDNIDEIVDRRIQDRETRREQQKAIKYFDSTYAQFAKDPTLRQMVDQETIRVLHSNPGMPLTKIIDESVSNVKSRITSVVGKDEVDERVDRKRKASTPATASVQRRNPGKPKPPILSPIEQIKKARGQ